MNLDSQFVKPEDLIARINSLIDYSKGTLETETAASESFVRMLGSAFLEIGDFINGRRTMVRKSQPILLVPGNGNTTQPRKIGGIDSHFYEATPWYNKAESLFLQRMELMIYEEILMRNGKILPQSNIRIRYESDGSEEIGMKRIDEEYDPHYVMSPTYVLADLRNILPDSIFLP